MEKKFIKVRTIKDYVVSLGLIAVGAIVILLPTAATINFLGSFLVLTGLFLVLARRSGYKNVETGEVFCKSERFFSHNRRAELTDKVENCPDSIEREKTDDANALRLDIYFCEKSEKAYLQLFEFVPYQYVPCTGMVECPAAEIIKIR